MIKFLIALFIWCIGYFLYCAIERWAIKRGYFQEVEDDEDIFFKGLYYPVVILLLPVSILIHTLKSTNEEEKEELQSLPQEVPITKNKKKKSLGKKRV